MNRNRTSQVLLTRMIVIALFLAGCVLAGCSAALAPDGFGLNAPFAAPGGESAAMRAQVAQEGSVAPEASAQRKIVARATLDLVVSDTQSVVDAITSLMAELGGYISNANLYKSSYGDSELLQGTLTLRVPADRLEEAMTQLEALAVSVQTRTLNREDVTDQYTDLDAQLRNLEATENELREMLAEVRARPDSTPEDILAVHGRLMEIRGQIEQTRGRKNLLDNLIGLSTIDVTLRPDALSQPVVEQGWRPGVIVREALRALVAALQWLGSVAIWMALYVLPILVIIFLPFVLLFLVVRAIVRRRRSRRQAALPAADE
jgi:hypothetical protein